jgi:hypothetical protein
VLFDRRFPKNVASTIFREIARRPAVWNPLSGQTLPAIH